MKIVVLFSDKVKIDVEIGVNNNLSYDTWGLDETFSLQRNRNKIKNLCKEMHSATKNKTEILEDAFNLKNIARKQT